jgi:hypothetical protein
MPSRSPASLFVLSDCNFVSTVTLTRGSMQPDVFFLVLPYHGARASGLIQCFVLPLRTCLAATNVRGSSTK